MASDREHAQSQWLVQNITRDHPLGQHDVCPVSPLTQEWGGPLHERGVEGMRPTQWRRQLDEMLVKVNGKTNDLRRAVDHESEALEAVVTKQRDKQVCLCQAGTGSNSSDSTFWTVCSAPARVTLLPTGAVHSSRLRALLKGSRRAAVDGIGRPCRRKRDVLKQGNPNPRNA